MKNLALMAGFNVLIRFIDSW